MSNKWISVWDDSQTITGSVYLTPTYASGTEVGLDVYTAPATKFFSPDVGAPARHVNWALQQLGNNAAQVAQHMAMSFRLGKWTETIYTTEQARGNRGFLLGSSAGVYFLTDSPAANALEIYTASVTRSVLLDDSPAVTPAIWSFDNQVNNTHNIGASSVTSSNNSGIVPMVAGSIGTNSLVIGTSGTAVIALQLSGTTFTSTAVPTGTYNFTSTATWGKSQVYLGANTATGPLLFFTRDLSTNNYLYTTNGTTLNKGTWPISTSATRIEDVAYDDVQSLFVLCTRPAAGGSGTFYTSADGASWTVSSTATMPSGVNYLLPGSDGMTAFKILGGIWLLASESVSAPDYIYGTGGTAGQIVYALYSLDFGRTWYRAACIIGGTAGKLKITTSVDRFLISTDVSIAISGRIGYPEGI